MTKVRILDKDEPEKKLSYEFNRLMAMYVNHGYHKAYNYFKKISKKSEVK